MTTAFDHERQRALAKALATTDWRVPMRAIQRRRWRGAWRVSASGAGVRLLGILGGAVYLPDGRRVAAGQAVLSRLDEAVAWRADARGAEAVVIACRVPATAAVDPCAGVVLPIVVDDDGDQPWGTIAAEAMAARASDPWARPTARARAIAMLVALMAAAVRAGAVVWNGDGAPGWLPLVLRAIEHRCGDPVFGPTDLADLAACSPSHFRRRFQRHTGQSPRDAIVAARHRLAKRLLRDDPDRTIASIARQCGYGSAKHFAARFRQTEGTSPTAWRNASSG